MTNSETDYYSKGLDFLLKKSYKQGISDALNKIKVKIEWYKSTIDNAISEDELKIEGMKEAYVDCLNVIDEYKAEIEPQEGSKKELKKIVLCPTLRQAFYEWHRLADTYADMWIDVCKKPMSLTSKYGTKYIFHSENEVDKLIGFNGDIINIDKVNPHESEVQE